MQSSQWKTGNTHTHTHTLSHAHTHTHSYTLTHTHIHTLTRTHIHSLIHSHTHTHTLIHSHMHSHTHTCMQRRKQSKTHFNLCPSTSKTPPTVQGRLGMLQNVFPQLNSRLTPVASELPLVCWFNVKEVAFSAGSLTCVPTLRPKSVRDDVWTSVDDAGKSFPF